MRLNKIKLSGFGFTRGLAADIQSSVTVEKHIEIRKMKVKKRRMVLTVVVDSDAEPGHRDLVLTAPDYTQVVVDGALRITR